MAEIVFKKFDLIEEAALEYSNISNLVLPEVALG